jgi:F-type H+-transporting ATPase subunit alpha
MQEILKQPQYDPMPLENQVMVIFAGTNGYADTVPLDRMKRWESDLIRNLMISAPEVGKDIAEKKLISPETEKKLRAALEAFQSSWQ